MGIINLNVNEEILIWKQKLKENLLLKVKYNYKRGVKVVEGK